MNKTVALFISIALLLGGAVFGLKPNDVCSLPYLNECKKSKNLECVSNHAECPASYQIRCGLNICTIDEQTCIDYLRLDTSLKNINVVQMSVSTIYEKRIRIYKSFVSKINHCQKMSFNTQILNKNKICSRGKNCRIRLKNRSQNSHMLNSVKCPCRGEHSYECGNYCTHNKSTCDTMEMEKSTLNKLQSCGNDNIIFKQ